MACTAFGCQLAFRPATFLRHGMVFDKVLFFFIPLIKTYHMAGGGGVVFLSILLFRRETVRVSDLRLGQWGRRRSGLRLGAPMGASPPPLHRRPFFPLFVIFDNS